MQDLIDRTGAVKETFSTVADELIMFTTSGTTGFDGRSGGKLAVSTDQLSERQGGAGQDYLYSMPDEARRK